VPALKESEIVDLLTPYLASPAPLLISQLNTYLELLLRWNARTNLTAIRDPREIVRRHFGESLFASQSLGGLKPDTLLDLGSGAGFPGIPIALSHPLITITLAESQNKKSTFLREVVRTLGLHNVEVWAGRAESLPIGKMFHTVALRAVDDMDAAMGTAAQRAIHGMLILTTQVPELPSGFLPQPTLPIPGSREGVVLLANRA
jgi:16S rRNA (guanine527-N7)-methyltransferase